MRPNPRPLPRIAHGAATLVVVMVLFFIVALVAAYTSRNLIFEQRTSANQYRAAQAFEAAEAGVEWALTMLNSGRIDAACVPQNNPATSDESFRMRYLSIDADGLVTARLRSDGTPRQAACVFNGSDWQCDCPEDPALSLSAPSGTGSFPAFVLRFHDRAPDGTVYPAGVLRIESTGCTRLDSGGAVCASSTSSGDGQATVNAVVALKSALPAPPGAALSVRVDLDLSGAGPLNLTNTDAGSGGITLRVGGTVNGTPQALNGPAGTPSDPSNLARNVTVANPDGWLNDLTTTPWDPTKPLSDRMFAAVFAADRDTVRLQPAAVYVDCRPSCTASGVHLDDLASLNPGRVLWIDGDLDIDISDPIGRAASPALLVITGNLEASDSAAQVNGVVYLMENATGPTLTTTGTLLLNGALIAESGLSLSGGGTSSIVYDAAMLDLLRRESGSFVRVPGGWKDF
ncbi:MAG TPA: PilX N-terminal domain-containing pilus assembly protein [Rubrivivax sp.]|nr:PilX N-terminal domain-containing pilus assembly protein [Rubrivivax sp.]